MAQNVNDSLRTVPKEVIEKGVMGVDQNGNPIVSAPAIGAEERFVVQSCEGIEIKETCLVDHAAFTTRDFKIGEVLIEDHPLVLLPRGRNPKNPLFDKLDKITQEVNFGESLLYPLVYFKNANEEVRGRMLNFFCPDLTQSTPEDQASHRNYVNCCKKVAELEEFKEFSVELLVKVLLVCRTNQHGTGDGRHTSALYELGSKVTHSCSPNCMALISDFKLKYIAIMDIPRGEMVTFSYIDQFTLWKPTPNRRALLLTQRYFSCCCSRCVGPDYSRRLRCPACRDPMCLYFMPGQPSFISNPGEPVDRPWTCKNKACGKTWRDDEMNLERERELIEKVLVNFFSQAEGVKPRDLAVSLLDQCVKDLGECHFATAAMIYTMLALHHSAVDNKHRAPEDPTHVLQWAQHLMYWFSKTMPFSMAEATIARFAAQSMEMHGYYSQAGETFARAIPCLRVHFGKEHPTILHMEEFVGFWAGPPFCAMAGIDGETVRARYHRKKQLKDRHWQEVPDPTLARTQENKQANPQGTPINGGEPEDSSRQEEIVIEGPSNKKGGEKRRPKQKKGGKHKKK